MQKLNIFVMDKDLKQMMSGIIIGAIIGIAVTFFVSGKKNLTLETQIEDLKSQYNQLKKSISYNTEDRLFIPNTMSKLAEATPITEAEKAYGPSPKNVLKGDSLLMEQTEKKGIDENLSPKNEHKVSAQTNGKEESKNIDENKFKLIPDIYLILVLVISFIVMFIIIARIFFRLRSRYHAKKEVPIDIIAGQKMAPPKPERVEFAVFSPLGIVSGSMFKLDVWAYLPSQYSDILSNARELKREALLEKKYAVPVKRGTILSVLVEIDKLEVRDPTDTILWDGVPTKASYTVNVPNNASIGQYAGKASISYQGIVIAKINFLVSVSDTNLHHYVNNSYRTFFPRTAFASYADENSEEVFTCIQGMEKVAPDLDIFTDVFSLRSGDNWKEKLEQNVAKKDIFYLFWSNFASKSEWVDREWHLALSRRGLNYIDPVPLEDIPPPPELASLHFADAHVRYIQYKKLKKKMRGTRED